jgi:predicted DNA-binding transcriptional regulator YafY
MPDHGTKSYEGTEDVVDAIQDAIMKRRIIRYRYADARGRAGAGYLAPFRLAMYRHGLYVVGARLKAPDTDVSAAPLGVYAVERFAEAEVLKRHEFVLPPGSRVMDVLSGAFGPHLPDADGPHDVVVEFSAEKAHLVASRSWHPTQVITPCADGSVQIALRVPSLAPIVSWVLEWGPHACAISPPALVEQVVRELDAARARYRRS